MDFKNLEMNEFMFPPAKAGGNSKLGAIHKLPQASACELK
jgi:hypothetical protein